MRSGALLIMLLTLKLELGLGVEPAHAWHASSRPSAVVCHRIHQAEMMLHVFHMSASQDLHLQNEP